MKTLPIIAAVLAGGALTLTNALATSRNPHGNRFDWDETNFFLAFGDSYTYVQGTYGRQNYSFIGDSFNYSYTPTQLLNNKIIQNQIGTSAGGPNWVEYLTGCFSGLPSRCKKQLWDFAFAGADVSTLYTPLHHDYSVDLAGPVGQIAQWATYAKPILPVKLSKALVAVWIGINDISDSAKYTYPRGNASTYAELYDQIISTEFEALETVWEAGYKNYLIMNLPPLERTPGNIKSTTPLPNATMVTTYNNLISSHASNFSASHTGSKVMVFDTYKFLSGILDDPAAYGIKNSTGYCAYYNAPDIGDNYASYGCLPIKEYFWYNTGHITYRIHELLAHEVSRFLEQESRR